MMTYDNLPNKHPQVGHIALWYNNPNQIHYAVPVKILKVAQDFCTVWAEGKEQITVPKQRLDWLADQTLEGQNVINTALEVLKQKEIQDDTDAMYVLAFWLLTDHVLPSNPEQAKQYFEKIIQLRGDAFAKHYLAELFYGQSISKEDQAYYIDLVMENAKVGYAPAQHSLAYAYSVGRFTLPKDIEQSLFWYEKAVAQDYPQSMCALAQKYELGEDIEQDYKKAGDLYLKAMKQYNMAEAIFCLAKMIKAGHGFRSDPQVVKTFLQHAVERDYLPAQEMLNKLNQEGYFDLE